MKLRPRKYGWLNRSIVRGVSHGVNNYYRRKRHSRNANATIKHQENKNIQNTSSDIFIAILGVLGNRYCSLCYFSVATFSDNNTIILHCVK